MTRNSRYKNGDKPSILIVKLSAIGDVIMTTAATRALKRHMPEARITWAVETKSAGALEGNPDIDEIIVWKRDSVRQFFRLWRALRRRKFDISLDFQGLGRSALVSRISGAKRRIGWSDGRELSNYAYTEPFDCEEKPHGLRCYLGMLKSIGIQTDAQDGNMRIHVSDEEMETIHEILRGLGVSRDEPVAALVPATSRDFKYWREDGWAEVADKLWEQLGMRGIFLGAEPDRELVERILSRCKSPAVNAAGLTKLKLSAVMIARAGLVVAVDTGLMHAGVALGKPTIGMFSSTTAWRNHIHRPNFRMLRKQYDCVPCDKDRHCRTWECLLDITSEEVMEAVHGLLSQNVLKGAVG